MELTMGEERLTTFRDAVLYVSELAHARLDTSVHGHLERATALVLGGHVWLGEDGRHAQVLSSDGATWYRVNGNCTCMDAPQVPQGYCKHKLAVQLYKRAGEVLAQKTDAETRGHGDTGGEGDTATRRRGDAETGSGSAPRVPASGVVAASPFSASAPLPEAPASANVRVKVGGHEVQWTLRDVDEARLAARLEALLTRYPEAVCAGTPQREQASAAPPAGPPVCQWHGPLKESTKAPGTWFCSKKMADGSYCSTRHPER
jgi:hypothetical protein